MEHPLWIGPGNAAEIPQAEWGEGVALVGAARRLYGEEWDECGGGDGMEASKPAEWGCLSRALASGTCKAWAAQAEGEPPRTPLHLPGLLGPGAGPGLTVLLMEAVWAFPPSPAPLLNLPALLPTPHHHCPPPSWGEPLGDWQPVDRGRLARPQSLWECISGPSKAGLLGEVI